MKIFEDEPTTLTEVAKVLKDKKKLYSAYEMDLLYEQNRALDHAAAFAKASSKDVKEMMKQLSGLEMELSKERIVKIIDMMPDSVDDIRAIFAKERFKYNEEELKSITDIVDQYR